MSLDIYAILEVLSQRGLGQDSSQHDADQQFRETAIVGTDMGDYSERQSELSVSRLNRPWPQGSLGHEVNH